MSEHGRVVVNFLALGPLEVHVDGEALALGPLKRRAVLGALLLHAGRRVDRDLLVDEVWPEDPPRDPARNLQVHISALRKALGPHALTLETLGNGYRISPPEGSLDVRLLEDAVDRAATLAHRGDHVEVAAVAAQGLALWRGRPYDDVRMLPGTAPEAARLESMRLDLIARSFAARLALGEHRQAVSELEQLVRAHPLREDLRAHLLVALHRSGLQHRALETYREGRTVRVGQLGLEPGEPLQQLHQQILRDDPALQVEDAAIRDRRHLPAQMTPLIGRRTEIEEITGLLREPGTRLVTATGTGGIGKTRVGIQAAHELADFFTDGVYFIGLADLTDSALVTQTVAETLGVEEAASRSLVDVVGEHLRHRVTLLVLDNVEHVLDAVPEISELLARSPGTKVLATSRVRLGLYGEQEYPIGPLPLEEAAVRLFDQRARAASRFYAGSDRDGVAVRAICRRLDRLPLAIELVAARAGSMDLAGIVAGLDRSLDLAGPGPRDRSARQRTLRDAVEWSHNLLDDRAQRLFCSVAVFAGGFTSEAARAVLGEEAGHLEDLVAANLLQPRQPGCEAQRFEMLQTIRAYATEKLAESGADVTTGEAHCAYYLALAEDAAHGLRGPDRDSWTARLNTERDNLRAALSRLHRRAAQDAASGDLMLRLAASLSLYWYESGSVGEAVGWLQNALAVAPRASDPVRAHALHGLGILLGERGESVQALRLCEESCRLFRRVGDAAWVARSLNSQGGLKRDLGHPQEAEALLEEGLALRRKLNSPELPVTVTLAHLAICALDRGHLDRARALCEECAALASAVGGTVRASALALLADVEVEAGHPERSADLLAEAVPVLQREDATFRLVECLDTMAAVAAATGRASEAATLVAAADARMVGEHATMVPADRVMRERRLCAALASLSAGEHEEARGVGAEMSLADAIEFGTALLATPVRRG